MKTVYFVRHGESEANVGAPIFTGEESRLTPKGVEQAKFIAKRCANLQVDVILSSPAVRTLATAREITLITGKNAEVHEMFTERKLPSQLLGKPRNRADENCDTEQMYTDWFRSFYEPNLQVGDVENFATLKSRVSEALQYLQARPESRILVVTHGFFLHMTASLVLLGENLSIDDFRKAARAIWMDNTGLTRLDYITTGDNKRIDRIPYQGWALRVWNDHAHLG